MKYPIIWVTWYDACGKDRVWLDKDMDLDLAAVASTGFLVKETKLAIAIATSYHQDMIACPIVIPKSCILERKILHHATKGSEAGETAPETNPARSPRKSSKANKRRTKAGVRGR